MVGFSDGEGMNLDIYNELQLGVAGSYEGVGKWQLEGVRDVMLGGEGFFFLRVVLELVGFFLYSCGYFNSL